jgi:hypothetical protein
VNPDFSAPSSIPSIKRLARAIQGVEGCKYSDALETAAQRAGHPTFHAAMIAAKASSSLPQYPVTLIEHWRDVDAKEAGVMELTLAISQPLTCLVKPHQMEGRLGAYKIAGADRLVSQVTIHGRETTARWFVARAGRVLQFMDATGLKPSKKHRNIWPKDDTNLGMPGADHYVVWYHPELRQHVITDEPYHGSVRRNDIDRTEWCERFGYVMQPVEWPGMHNPHPGNVGGTVLYLIAKAADQVPLEALAKKANALPSPVNNEDPITTNRRQIRLLR